METGVVNCPVSVDRGAAVDRMPRPESGRDPRCRRRVDSPFLISVRSRRTRRSILPFDADCGPDADRYVRSIRVSETEFVKFTRSGVKYVV